MMSAPVLGTIGELKGHALGYASGGLEVFPLHADKTPRTTNGMKDATTDPEQISAWWDQWPDAPIGCRIPPDTVVIDVDPKHNGMATWKLLKSTYGELPHTRAHQSGRGDGGGHLWFRRPPGKLSARALHRWAKDHGTGQAVGKHSWVAGIDLLHHGHRYTILPPSPHPETGRPYQWATSRGLEIPPAAMPAWLAELIIEAPQDISVPGPRLANGEVDSIADWFTATTSWADLLIPEGWRLIAGSGDDDGSKWRHPNATAACSATIRHDCLFVYTPNTDFEPTEEGAPHGYTRFRAFATLAHRGNLSDAARDARHRKDGCSTNGNHDDWSWVLTDGIGATTIELVVYSVEDSGIQPICWPDFWNHEHADEDWLIEPVIPRGRSVALWAIHKTGKSLIALEMAATAATGTTCLGNPVQAPLDVIYLDMEMTEDDLHDRLDSLGYGPDTNLEHLHYYLLPSLPPLDTAAGATTLLALVERHHAAFLVIDTMARVVAGEENSADTYRAFYRHTGLHLKARGVSVLRLDHGGKDPTLGQRGSSAKGDDVDVVWQLSATDDGLAFTRRAARMSWVPETVALRRHETPDLHHFVSPDLAVPAGTHALIETLDQLGAPLDITQKNARALLNQHGHGAKNTILGYALKSRRRRPISPEELVISLPSASHSKVPRFPDDSRRSEG